MDEKATSMRIKGLMIQHDFIRAKGLVYVNRAKKTQNYPLLVKAQAYLTVAKWILRTVKIYADHWEDIRGRGKPVKVSFD
jgi:virulence-associated protein VapD